MDCKSSNLWRAKPSLHGSDPKSVKDLKFCANFFMSSVYDAVTLLFTPRTVNVALAFLPNATINHDAKASLLEKPGRADKRVVVPPEQVAEHSDQGRWFQEKPTSLSPLPVRWMGTLNL